MVLKMSFLKALLMLVFSHNVSLGYFLLSFFTQVYSLLQSTAHFLTAFFFQPGEVCRHGDFGQAFNERLEIVMLFAIFLKS